MAYKDKEKQKEYQRTWEKTKRKGQRHKVWTMIFYEESAPDWRDELSEVMIPCVVSPIHDQDKWTKADEKKNPEHKEGQLKKPHYHLLVEYPNQVDYETVMSDFKFLNSFNCKYVKSKGAMAQYLCHLNEKNKTHYSSDGIVEFCGADWFDWCSEVKNIHAAQKEMRMFIRENNIFDFYLFWDWCDNNNDEWSRILDGHCYGIERYIKSLRASAKDGSLVEPGRGLSTTPSPGGAEPRTPNPK